MLAGKLMNTRLALSCILKWGRQSHNAELEKSFDMTVEGCKHYTEQGASKFNPTWRDFNLQNG